MTSKQRECTEGRFLDDTKDHQINIEKDDGVHRFIRFRSSEDSCYWFDLITWPGHLCISGDCGTYVFSRNRDMFEFFKMNDNDFNKRKDVMLNINPHYWGEKLQAIGTNAGHTEFDSDDFELRVKEYFGNFFEDSDYSDEIKKEVWDEIDSDVIFFSDEEHRAYAEVHNFRYELPDGEYFEFVDFFDGGGTERFTFSYIWCLYAIVWGIMKYEEVKNANQ